MKQHRPNIAWCLLPMFSSLFAYNYAATAQPEVEQAFTVVQESVPRSQQTQMILFMTKFLLLHSMLEQTACGQQLEPKMAVACRRLCDELMATAKEFDLTEQRQITSANKRTCFGCPSGSFNFREWVDTIKRVYDYYLSLITPEGFTPITPEEVAAGYTINSPGVYILMGPATYSGTGNAITINSPGVTLDLGGHRIDYTGTVSITGIYANNQNNCTIQNGTVTNFYYGIAIRGEGHNWTVKNITCIGSGFTFGIFVDKDADLIHTRDSLCHDNSFGFYQAGIIESCHAQNNLVGFGPVVEDDYVCVLKNNQAVNNSSGISLSFSVSSDPRNSLVMGCYAADNSGSGFATNSTSPLNDPSLVNNHAQDNGTPVDVTKNYLNFDPAGIGHYYETTNAFSWEFWECLSL